MFDRGNWGVYCATFACLVASVGALQGQEDKKSEGEANRTLALPAEVIRQPPMTVAQKYKYHMKQAVDPWGVLRGGAGAALDQWRDHPGGWGQGWDTYGVRVASHFGQNFIKQNILFGVQALDHENPEHIRSKRSGFKNRV